MGIVISVPLDWLSMCIFMHAYEQGVQDRMVLTFCSQFFRIFEKNFFCFVVAIFDLVDDEDMAYVYC